MLGRGWAEQKENKLCISLYIPRPDKELIRGRSDSLKSRFCRHADIHVTLQCILISIYHDSSIYDHIFLRDHDEILKSLYPYAIMLFELNPEYFHHGYFRLRLRFCTLHSSTHEIPIEVKHVSVLDSLLSERLAFPNVEVTTSNATSSGPAQNECEEPQWLKILIPNYRPQLALNYYTETSHFHRIINHALRQGSPEKLYHVQHAVHDIMSCLGQNTAAEENGIFLTVYRGQQMTTFEKDRLLKCIGDVIPIKSFFSTTFSFPIASIFSGNGLIRDRYMVSVIFKIYLDTGQPLRPYGLIYWSAEDELLLSPGTKFVLMSCRKLHDKTQLWLMELQAVPEKKQEQLRVIHGETFSLTRLDGRRAVVVVRSHPPDETLEQGRNQSKPFTNTLPNVICTLYFLIETLKRVSQ